MLPSTSTQFKVPPLRDNISRRNLSFKLQGHNGFETTPLVLREFARTKDGSLAFEQINVYLASTGLTPAFVSFQILLFFCDRAGWAKA